MHRSHFWGKTTKLLKPSLYCFEIMTFFAVTSQKNIYINKACLIVRKILCLEFFVTTFIKTNFTHFTHFTHFVWFPLGFFSLPKLKINVPVSSLWLEAECDKVCRTCLPTRSTCSTQLSAAAPLLGSNWQMKAKWHLQMKVHFVIPAPHFGPLLEPHMVNFIHSRIIIWLRLCSIGTNRVGLVG